MFNINWDLEVGKWDIQTIGKIEVYSGAYLTVKKHRYSKTLDGLNFITQFNVGCHLFGCTMEKIFDSRKECEAYLERQVKNTSKYARLKAQRDALSNRLLPLQRKWSKNSDALFELAESPFH